MITNWKHIKTIANNEPFEIQGINIWDYEWRDSGEKINLKDPIYFQDYSFSIFNIKTKKSNILFAAGEFSNCVWGIYIQEKENPFAQQNTPITRIQIKIKKIIPFSFILITLGIFAFLIYFLYVFILDVKH
jgi:hypothetical protein